MMLINKNIIWVPIGHCISIVLLLLIGKTTFAEPSISVLINPQYNAYSSDTLFAVPDEYIEKPEITSKQTIEVTGNHAIPWSTINYLFSAYLALNDRDSAQTNISTNELYLAQSFNNWEVIMGRRINSGGFGYGFRPLDVIQQYDQQSTLRQSLIGKNMLGLEYFSGLSSWSLLWINPRQKSAATDNNTQLESLLVKYSTSLENSDLQTLIRYNKKNKLQAGLGGIQIVSDAFSVHSSLLISQQYQKQLHFLAGQTSQLLASEYPYETITQQGGIQALIGFSWSTSSKHSIIAEYWYNDMAYSKQQWDNLFQLAERQQQLLEQPGLPTEDVLGNIAWTASATQSAMLSMHNLMLQWNYDADYWKPSINILMSPADSSSMLTLAVSRTYNLLKIETGVRSFNGSKDSVYGGLIIDRMLYMTVSSEY